MFLSSLPTACLHHPYQHLTGDQHTPLLACDRVHTVCLQEIEYLVSREMDDKQYNLDVGQRVYVELRPEAIMGFEMDEIDSAPIL